MTTKKDQKASETDDTDTAKLKRIKACRLAVRKAQTIADEQSEASKEANAAFGQAIQSLLAEIDNDQMQLSLESAGEDDWKNQQIDVLKLSRDIIRKLKDANLGTLGALATRSETRGLSNIKGINEAVVSKIVEAHQRYWAEHPEVE